MYERNTVFILGAGASWHYGYPTGEALVQAVRNKADRFIQYCQSSSSIGNTIAPRLISPGPHSRADWLHGARLFSTISDRLSGADPVVIDYFLSQNPDLKGIGAFLIAWVILEREEEYRKNKNLINRGAPPKNDNWVRFILHRLVQTRPPSDRLSSNKVCFVTFNYDISLETALSSGLKSLSYLDPTHIDSFMGDDRIIHVYGSIRKEIHTTPMDNNRFAVLSNWANGAQNENERYSISILIDEVDAASKEIFVIEIDNKVQLEDRLSKARGAIIAADDIYILGYGFDNNNNHRIGLDLIWNNARQNGGGRRVFFTNFGDSNRINKVAGHLLRDDPAKFVTPGGGPTSTTGVIDAEKSIKNVYDALAFDFDH